MICRHEFERKRSRRINANVWNANVSQLRFEAHTSEQTLNKLSLHQQPLQWRLTSSKGAAKRYSFFEFSFSVNYGMLLSVPLEFQSCRKPYRIDINPLTVGSVFSSRPQYNNLQEERSGGSIWKCHLATQKWQRTIKPRDYAENRNRVCNKGTTWKLIKKKSILKRQAFTKLPVQEKSMRGIKEWLITWIKIDGEKNVETLGKK